MIDTLSLVAGDQVGVLYCTNESNSLIQYEAVKELFEAEGIVVKAYTFSETTELQTVANSMANECKAVYIPSDNTVAANDLSLIHIYVSNLFLAFSANFSISSTV